MATPLCGVCCSQAAALPADAVTQVGPLSVCAAHVDAALEMLGYQIHNTDVITFLESVDADELESTVAEKVGDYETETTGKAVIAVLIEAAREQEQA